MQYTHTTPIFILRHKLPDFEGVMLGVDFRNGRGSTSSVQDAAALMLHGCTIEDEGARAIVESYAADKKAECSKRMAELKSMEAREKKPPQTWPKLLEGVEERRLEREEAARPAQKSARWKRAHNYISPGAK